MKSMNHTKDGRIVEPHNMGNAHLMNTIRLCVRKKMHGLLEDGMDPNDPLLTIYIGSAFICDDGCVRLYVEALERGMSIVETFFSYVKWCRDWAPYTHEETQGSVQIGDPPKKIRGKTTEEIIDIVREQATMQWERVHQAVQTRLAMEHHRSEEDRTNSPFLEALKAIVENLEHKMEDQDDQSEH